MSIHNVRCPYDFFRQLSATVCDSDGGLRLRNEMRPVVDDVESIVNNLVPYLHSPREVLLLCRGETSRDMKRAGSISYYVVGS